MNEVADSRRSRAFRSTAADTAAIRMRLGVVLVLTVVSRTLSAQILVAATDAAQRSANSVQQSPARIGFPPPRLSLTLSGGQFAIAGRPYAFRSSEYHSAKFKPGPLVRLDATLHAIGPISVKLGVARATPRWETVAASCECSYPGAGLHTVELMFYDIGARISLVRSEDWPPDQLYLDVDWGVVHQRVVNPVPLINGTGTNGMYGIGLGGSYSLLERLALTLHVADKVTRYSPNQFVATRRTQSNSILTTAGLTFQLF